MVGEVHGLADRAPAHPDQGLHHTHVASQSQDVPTHWARPELRRQQTRDVLAEIRSWDCYVKVSEQVLF